VIQEYRAKATRGLLAARQETGYSLFFCRVRAEEERPDGNSSGKADRGILPLAEEFSVYLNILLPLVWDL
jgi:hypothetical protein